MRWSLLAIALFSVARDAYAYIDPGTTHAVLSSLGAVFAAIGAGLITAGAAVKYYGKKIVAGLRNLGQPRVWQPVAKYGAAMALPVIAFGVYQSFSGKTAAPASAESSTDKRLVILGFDGMDPELTRKFMKQGDLPNFKSLASQGDFKDLTTVNPVQSPVVWSSMGTGYGPGRHGISDFIQRKGDGYIPTLSLTKRNPGNFFGDPDEMFQPPVKPELFFWERLSAEKVPAKVLRWPLTFPAEGNAEILSGLGTPDISGNMGRYTLYTSAPEYFPRDVKGNINKLNFNGENVAKAAIPGPKTKGLTGEEQAEVPMTIRRRPASDTVVIEIGEEKLTLSPDQLSRWVSVDFSLDFAEDARAMTQFLVIQSDPQTHIYMAPVQIDPEKPLYPISTNSLSQNLSKQLGRFHTLGMAEDVNALGDGILNEDQFLKLCASIMRDAEDMFWNEFRKNQSGLFSFVFDTPDRIQHMFWRFRDKSHPMHDAKLAKKYDHVIKDYYRWADDILGEVLRKIDSKKTTVMVVSDHGFTSYRRNLHLNAWLVENGYMALKDDARKSAPLFKKVDWSETKAFAMGFSQVFINQEGRDEHGIVAPKEAAKLKKKLKRELLGITDPLDGQNPVQHVYDPDDLYHEKNAGGPDLVVGLAKGYRFSWQTAIGGSPGFVFSDNHERWSGDHCVDAAHVPGIVFANRDIVPEKPSVFDVAPTALNYFGVDVPGDMPGRDLLQSSRRNTALR